ncbi:MAG: hypothetical protein ACT4O1_15000 [Gemmatimonadota bacterium]
MAFRIVGGGTLGDETLPPQFQHALGGAATLPGYSTFSADCGARRSVVLRGNNDSFFPYYGCDRMALFSADYRADFAAVFFDAGRGWSASDAPAGAAHTATLYDAGAGILLGDVGIYGAVPLTGNDRAVKFFVRLGPRF